MYVWLLTMKMPNAHGSHDGKKVHGGLFWPILIDTGQPQSCNFAIYAYTYTYRIYSIERQGVRLTSVTAQCFPRADEEDDENYIAELKKD